MGTSVHHDPSGTELGGRPGIGPAAPAGPTGRPARRPAGGRAPFQVKFEEPEATVTSR